VLIDEFGTKLSRLVDEVKAAIAAGEKCVVFSAWTRLLQLAADALDDQNIAAVSLVGSLDERKEALLQFRGGGGGDGGMEKSSQPDAASPVAAALADPVDGAASAPAAAAAAAAGAASVDPGGVGAAVLLVPLFGGSSGAGGGGAAGEKRNAPFCPPTSGGNRSFCQDRLRTTRR
jgi:hypothetical protein